MLDFYEESAVRGLVTVFCAFATVLLGQSDPKDTPKDTLRDTTAFRADSTLVLVPVSVTDPGNRYVLGLAKEDLHLFEDGVEQKVTHFSNEDAPLSIGLLVDTSGSQRRLIEEERSASYRFFEQVLREDKDVAFVIHFDFEVELLQDLTASRKLLEKALHTVQQLPPDSQDEIARAMLTLAGGDGEPEEVDPAHLPVRLRIVEQRLHLVE